jgi:hypothetical protein
VAAYFLKGQKMQSILTSLTNPRWANANQTMIDCNITTSQFGDEVLPFTANKNDVEPHGRDIFSDIVSGKYGPILEYVAPSNPKIAQPTVDGAQTL